MSMRIEVWGPYGCFSRPEMKTERVSYDIITPSAARGLVEAIYWHPGLKYHIDRIYLLSPIQFTNIRRNEVRSTLLASAALSAAKGGTPPVLYTSQDIQQRAAMVLQDVHYVIECHFDLTDKAAPSARRKASAIISPALAAASSLPTSGSGPAATFLHWKKPRRTSDSCCMIWIILTRPTSARSSSGQSWSTG